MPIHDQGYRRYLGTRDAIGRSWQVMTRAGVMSVVSKRVFLGMMLAAWTPFVVRVVQFYFSTAITQASFLALEDKANVWPESSMFFGGVHAARRFGDVGVEGAGDPRRGGAAIVV